MVGRARVAQFLLGILEKYATDIEAVPVELNGGVGFVGIRDGELMAAWTVEFGPGGSHAVVQRAESGEVVTSDRPVRS